MAEEDQELQTGNKQTTMVLNISLDHLKEEEIDLILQVLERDAEIQKHEDARKRRLRESVRGERIPEKRLSIKLRTGEWMDEMKAPSRAMKRRGTDVVRASIRRKPSGKQDQGASTTKTERVTESALPGGALRNGNVASAQDQPDHVEPTVAEEISPDQRMPVRRTSVRRKKVSHDKQVTFDTDKTEKFVYEQTSIDSSDGIPPIESESTIPKIVIHSEEVAQQSRIEVAQPVEVTVITDEVETKTEENSEVGVFTSNATFESYHNAVKNEIYKKETDRQLDKEDNGMPLVESQKGTKKIKVVKRKGSSRRKGAQATDGIGVEGNFDATDEKPEEKSGEDAPADNTPEPASGITATGQKTKVIKRIGSSRRKVGKVVDDSSRDTNIGASEAQGTDEKVDKDSAKTELDAMIAATKEIVESGASRPDIEDETPEVETADTKVISDVSHEVVASPGKKVKMVKRKGISRRKKEKISDDSSRDSIFGEAELKSREESVDHSDITNTENVASTPVVLTQEIGSITSLPEISDKKVDNDAKEDIGHGSQVVTSDGDAVAVSEPEEKQKEISEIVSPIEESEEKKETEADNIVGAAVAAAITAEQKTKVIKRKGSSRRRPGKITDDSSWDALFGGAESIASPDHEFKNQPEKNLSSPAVDSNYEKVETSKSKTSSPPSVSPEVHADANPIISDVNTATNDGDDSFSDKLDLGLGDILTTISEKYDSMTEEVKDALTEIANDISPFNDNDDLRSGQGADGAVKSFAVDSDIQKALQEMANETVTKAIADSHETQESGLNNDATDAKSGESTMHKTPNIETESLNHTKALDEEAEPGSAKQNPIESILTTDHATLSTDDVKAAELLDEDGEITPTELEQKEDDDTEEQKSSEKLKKKAVKKVIKKKKVEKSEESPKSEAAQEDEEKVKVKKIVKKKKPEKVDETQEVSPKLEQETEESPSKNASQLTRKKTVRKKVVRRPPPSE